MEKLLTPKQAADLLGLHVKSIYRLVEQKRLPCLRVAGSRIRFKPSQLEKWAEGR